MYLALLKFKEKTSEKDKAYTKIFNTEEEAKKFTWDVMCNENKKRKNFDRLYTEVIELGSVFKS